MRFRTLQYDVPGVADGGGSAEIVFSLFNGTDGGPTDMNIDRWVNQFRTPEGDAAEAEITKTEVGGMMITRIQTAGSYQSMGAAAPRTGQGQIGAIIEAPGRRVFVRLVGPFHVSIEDLGGQPFAAANRRLTSLQLTMFQKAAM
jgi:hypothetical protein